MTTIFKGDDTTFKTVKRMRITLDTTESLSGCSAEFELCGVIKRIPDVSTGTFYVNFTREDTLSMPLGTHAATLRLYDSDSNTRTADNAIRVRVTDRIDEAYGENNAINITLGSTCPWSAITDKPSINGVVLEGNKTSAQLSIKGVVQATLLDLPEDYTTEDLRARINAINACLRSSMAALAAILLAPMMAFGSVGTNAVTTSCLNAIHSLSNVVVAIDTSPFASTGDVFSASSAATNYTDAAKLAAIAAALNETRVATNALGSALRAYADGYGGQAPGYGSVSNAAASARADLDAYAPTWSAKQDALPYPTNSIPASAITNAPWISGFTESDPDWKANSNSFRTAVVQDAATAASLLYQPKGSYLTSHQSLLPAYNYVDSAVSHKRDLTNNVCAADSFTAWSATLPTAPSCDWDAQPVFDDSLSQWVWNYTDWYAESNNSDPNATSVTFSFTEGGEGGRGRVTFPATRARAALSNDTFTTYAFVTNAVASATPDYTTNNAAFVKGVTNVLDAAVLEMVANSANTNAVAALNGMIEDAGLTDWKELGGGLAGLVAAIIAALSWLRKRKLDASEVAPAWSSETTYTLGANVTYNGKMYVSKQASNLGNKPTDENWWNVALPFSSVDTSTDPAASGLLSNAALDKGIVKVANAVNPYGYETPTLTDEAATDVFDAETAYTVGAYVKYDSEGGTDYSNYVCIAATTAGTLPTDTTYWANVTNKTCTAVDGATNRITVGESQTVTVTLPVPASNKTAECILRFNSPISLVGGVQVAAPSGKTFTYLDISGDDVEASTATGTKYYEQFYAIMPTATDNAYEVTVSTRALTARA